MLALSVRRPYADFLLDGTKRIENRSWFQPVVGLFVIHAARTHDWDHHWDWFGRDVPEDDNWGRLLGIATVVGAFRAGRRGEFIEKYGPGFNWLLRDSSPGPVCYVVSRPWTLIAPIRWQGQQRFFSVPDERITDQLFYDEERHVREFGEYLGID